MDYTPPERVHGPGIRKAIRPLAEEIQKESGASKVIITCVYELRGTAEAMKMSMRVSVDNDMERNDAHPPRPKGDQLTNDAEQSVSNILKNKPKEGEQNV
jgi:hypothetical protein